MAQLISELQKAGIPRKNAVAIGRIFGNSLQEMRRGPETKDLTSPKMRLVGKEKRIQEFKNIDFLEGDPDYRKFKKQLSEDKPEPVQVSTVQADKDPNTTDDSFGVTAGPFVEVESQGDGVKVGLRVVGVQPILCQDSESGSLVGKSLRCNAGQQTGLINFNVEPRGEELIINLSIDLARLAAAVQDQLINNAQEIEQITGQPSGGGLRDAFVDVQLRNNGLCFTTTSGKTKCVATKTCS